jgi:RNA polymerase sigma-70 factor (ECF subfamily)
MDKDKLNSTQDKLSVSDFMRHVLDNDRRIYGYIYALIPNPSEAEDLFQDTVTIMWEKYESYLPGSDFGAWGIGIAYNLVRNYRRKMAKSRLQFSEDVEQLIECEAQKATSNLDDKLNALNRCLSKLTREDKKALKLKYEYNWTAQDIAGKIGCSVKAVYSKLARANDFLLRCVKRSLTQQNL